MSWDIVLFNTGQKINSVEEVDETLFHPVDFDTALHRYFVNIIHDDTHREIPGEGFSIDYFAQDSPSGAIILNLYGENALYAIIHAAKAENWQIYDTGNGEMIDLDAPWKNGYADFQAYLDRVIEKSAG